MLNYRQNTSILTCCETGKTQKNAPIFKRVQRPAQNRTRNMRDIVEA